MPQIVNTPNGDVEFPDGMQTVEMQKVLDQHFSAPQAATPQVGPAPMNSIMQAQMSDTASPSFGVLGARLKQVWDTVNTPVNQLMGTENPINMMARGLSMGQPMATVTPQGKVQNTTEPQKMSPFSQGVADKVNDMVFSPLGFALALGGGVLPKVAGKLMAGGFTAKALMDAPQTARDLGRVSVEGTPEEKQKAAGGALAQVLGIGAGGLGMVHPEVAPGKVAGDMVNETPLQREVQDVPGRVKGKQQYVNENPVNTFQNMLQQSTQQLRMKPQEAKPLQGDVPVVVPESVKGGAQENLSPEAKALSVKNNSPESWGDFGGLNKKVVDEGSIKSFERTTGETGSIIHPVELFEKAVNHFKTGDIRDAIIYGKDAADNITRLNARGEANTIRNDLGRVFTKETTTPREALTFAVEAGGDKSQLNVMRQKIQSSTQAAPGLKTQALKAIDFAEKNWPQMQVSASKYNKVMDSHLQKEIASGVNTTYRKNYVPHDQDIDNSMGFFRGGSGEEAMSSGKQRVHDTFADSIAAGVKPKTLDATSLMERRLGDGNAMRIQNKMWLDSFKGTQDPVTKLPLIDSVKTVTRPDGSTYQQAPKGYTPEYIGGQQVAVHNGYEGVFDAVTRPSEWMKTPVGRAVMTYNAESKSVNLALDTFHMARIGLWNAVIRPLGISTMEAPKGWSYKEGKTLLDNTTPELQKMLANGEIPAKWGPRLLQNKKDIDLLVKNGYNLGRISDNSNELLRDKIPIIGKAFSQFDKGLFDSFQRGAMTEIGLLELKRYRGMYKSKPDSEIARMVSKDLNTRFGNLGRQGILTSKTAQDTARALFLAPQWNEGLIKSEAGAIRQLGETMMDAATGKRLAAGVLLRSVGAMVVGQFFANQLINYYTRGQPTWKNKEEGMGAKLSAFIPNENSKDGSGFFLHPMGLGAEVTHLLLSKYEKSGDLLKTVGAYLRSRDSQVMKPIMTAVTGKDSTGRLVRPEDMISHMVEESVPKPIPYEAAKAGLKGQEEFPGQMQKQLMSSLGVKTDQVPGATQRVQKLAQDFNKKDGIEPAGEFYGSKYYPLVNALKSGNVEEAQKQLDVLEKTEGHKKVNEYMLQYPHHFFTGSEKREHAFKNSLTTEQSQAYAEAVNERKAVKDKYNELRYAPKDGTFKGFQE